MHDMGKIKRSWFRDTVVDRLPLLGESIQGVKSTSCINIRRRRGSDALELASARERKLTSGTEKGRLFAVVNHPLGRLEFYVSETLAVSVWNASTEMTARVGTLSGQLLSAKALGIDRVALSTEAGGEIISISDVGVCRIATRGDLFAPLRFETYSEMQMSEKVAARDFKNIYDGRSGSLSDADADALADDLLRAYEKLAYAAGASGLCMQPILARYRLEGRHGEMLFRSAPVVVMPESGFQCMDEMSAKLSDDGRCRESFSVSAHTWRLRLISVENRVAVGSGEVERLVVEATVPIHPVNFGGVQSAALGIDGTAGARLRFFIPGCSVAMAKATKRAAERLRQVYIHCDDAFRDVAEVKRPFDGSGSVSVEFSPYGTGMQTAKAQTASIDRLIAVMVEERNAILARCRPPHRFYAAACDRVGGNMVWGNVTARRYQGYPLEMFALSTAGEGDWKGSVTVTMADGKERAVTGSTGRLGAPTNLSPLLVYPSADAVEMTIGMERGGERLRSTFPLTPAPDGLSAYYLDPQCRHIELETTEEEFAFGDNAVVERTFKCAAISAPLSDCFNPVCAAEAADGEIVAVKSAEHRAGGWDYSQRRVYLFSRGGTQLGRLDGKGVWASFNPFDSRPVECADAVVATTDDRYPIVFIAGGDLLGLTPSSLTTLASSISGEMLGWDSGRNELHVYGKDGSEAVMQQLGGGYYLSVGELAAMTPFEYRLTTDAPRCGGSFVPPRLKAVVADLSAEKVSGEMSVEGDGRLISKFRFGGAIERHLPMRVLSSGCRKLTVKISGMAAGNVEIRSIRLLWH